MLFYLNYRYGVFVICLQRCINFILWYYGAFSSCNTLIYCSICWTLYCIRMLRSIQCMGNNYCLLYCKHTIQYTDQYVEAYTCFKPYVCNTAFNMLTNMLCKILRNIFKYCDWIMRTHHDIPILSWSAVRYSIIL